MNFLKKLSANKRGATAIEYALIAGLISVAAVVVLGEVGEKVGVKFGDVSEGLKPAPTQPQ